MALFSLYSTCYAYVYTYLKNRCVDSKAETSIITPQTIDPHQQQQRKLEIPPAVSFMLQNIYGPRLKSCKVKNGTCSTHSNLSPFIHLLCCVRNASKSFNNACAPDCITLLQKSRKLKRKKCQSLYMIFCVGFLIWQHDST